MTHVIYRISDLTDYINWHYLFYAWGLSARMAAVVGVHECDACRRSWIQSFSAQDRPQATEAVKLFRDAQRMLARLAPYTSIHAAVEIYEANADGDDIVLYLPDSGQDQEKQIFKLPMLRQQQPDKDGFCWCLSDFIRPLEQGKRDRIGVFATTTRNEVPQVSQVTTLSHYFTDVKRDDSYVSMLLQTLSDRLAEAAAERLHQQVRTSLWGYAPDEHLTMQQLHAEEFQGIRPAVGYPSMPDTSMNCLIAQLLPFDEMGITLTEHGMMIPHASVSGLMIAHPQSHYFALGKITQEQLADYAHRRRMSPEDLKPYLAANLNHL